MTEQAKEIITNPIIKAQQKPKSMRAAINAKCAECMGCTINETEPGFRSMIRDCTAGDCPLYNLRPYQVKARGEDR